MRPDSDINNRIDGMLGSYRVPDGKTHDEAWQALFDRINQNNDQGKVRVMGYLLTRLAVAASFLVVLSFSTWVYLYRMGNEVIYLGRGEHATLLLPDSSKVTLNADSKLTYNKNRWFLERKVVLEGEALFEVTKGNRFSVISAGAKTTVLGTVFNVYNRNGLVRVTCYEGRVKVETAKSKSKTLLTKGMEAKTMGYALEVKKEMKENSAPKPSWTQDEFYFNNEPLTTVIEELERQFDVDIFLDTDTMRFYSGYFKRKDIEQALDLVCIPLDLNWRYSGELIVITNNK
jgi:ferric-dicitrate binding protein FerR (iron transport regulator)